MSARTQSVCEACGHHTVHLSAAELRVVHAVGLGLTNKEIGRRHGNAESTVKNQLNRIMRAFNVHDRVQLLLTAHAHGTIDLPELAAQFVNDRMMRGTS